MLRFGKSALDRGLQAFARHEWSAARKLLAQAEASATRDYHLGLLYWRGLGGPSDYAAGAGHLARAAEAGHVRAQTAYGIALRAGVGVACDEEEARRFFRAAAAGDDMEAALQLATLSEGEEARHWLERAAEMGHPGAMRALSDMLLEETPVESLAWLYASATLSNDDSARRRAAALAEELSPDDIDIAHRIGRNHVRRQFRMAQERR